MDRFKGGLTGESVLIASPK